MILKTHVFPAGLGLPRGPVWAVAGFCLVAVMLAAVTVTGCAQPPSKAIVSGSVKHKGTAVAEGIVWLSYPSKGRVESTRLRSGAFTFAQPIDTGEVLAAVTPEQYLSEPPHPVPGTILLKDAADIPKKYHAESTSGLKYTLVPGRNELAIELE
jgi:hypothetical protein